MRISFLKEVALAVKNGWSYVAGKGPGYAMSHLMKKFTDKNGNIFTQKIFESGDRILFKSNGDEILRLTDGSIGKLTPDNVSYCWKKGATGRFGWVKV
ncbi:hypothetical protein IJ596_00270 [bacterium]|nr:hypothetical protein [bacterium]